MGLIFIPRSQRLYILSKLKNKKYRKLQTTKLISNLIKDKFKIKAIKRDDHWYEFDDYDDLINYKKNFNSLISN